MRIVLQRVSSASVRVSGEVVGAIGAGVLLLVGIEESDEPGDVAAAVRKIVGLRIFPDGAGLMNLSVLDAGGAALVVSQFTLIADARRGRRPSFARAAEPNRALALLERMIAGLQSEGLEVESGSFGEKMEVELVNDGPVTIVLDVKEGRIA